MLLFFGNDELCSRRAAPATPKWSFLTIKKRLRQAASRGKWCFSLRNAILGQKKAPAASLQPEENGFGPPQQGSHWFTPTKEPLVHPKKGTIGAPQEGSHWFTPTKEPLVHPNKGAIGSPQQGNHWFTQRNHWFTQRNHWCTPRREPLVLQMVKNTKIFTKWSSIQHFEMSPIPKCTVFKTLHESDRVIAPKPLK